MWLQGLFAPRPTAPSAPPRTRSPEGFAEHESRVLAEFEKTYGITFGNSALLKLALTHRSYLHVTGAGPRDSNERLEFLGDSVLGLVTSEHLYRKNPNEHEGQLTKTKSLLVSKAILSRRALAMGLGRYVLMSHSEVESGGRQRLSILADAFEAVIGAVYLDQGFGAARSFIERWLLREARVIAADKRHTNYKSHLQEYVQSTFRTHPVYRIRSAMGPDHSKQFMVEVMVGRKVLGEGRGRNKKEAEQAAARDALEQVGESAPASEQASARITERADRAERTEREERTAETQPARRSEPDRDDDDDSQRRRGRRGERGDSERGERREPAASPVPPPPPPPRVARPVTPPPRPVTRRRFDEDEHDEIGRPEGPDLVGEAPETRERPAPQPSFEPPSARTAEPEPERDWDRPVTAPADDEESEDMPEFDVSKSYEEPLPPDEPPPSRTAEPAPPATTESQSFGRRARRRGGR